LILQNVVYRGHVAFDAILHNLKESDMKKFLSLALVAMAVASLGLAETALAQRDAGSKIQGNYNFYSGSAGRTYQRHAYDHSRVLNSYASGNERVPKAVAQEHAKAIRQNVESSKKAYSRLSEAAKKDAAAAKHLADIHAAHAKVLAMCDMLDAECMKAEGDSVTICKCCADIEKDLKAADEAHDKLMKQLKLEEPKSSDSK
jgi:hypothetical protein